MAKYHYDLTGAEPIIRDVPVYDAATLVNGEFIMLDPAAASDSQYITGYTSDNTEMIDGLGIMNETLSLISKADHGDFISTAATTTEAAISSVASTVATGSRYGKAIINPFAVYQTEYSQADANTMVCPVEAAQTAWTPAAAEDNIDGGWVYTTYKSGNTNGGSLRYIYVNDGTDYTVTALTTDATDDYVKVLPIAARLSDLDATATSLMNLGVVGTGVSMCVVENYIGGGGRPQEPLRMQVHDNLDDLGSTTKLYADLICINHLYNPLS